MGQKVKMIHFALPGQFLVCYKYIMKIVGLGKLMTFFCVFLNTLSTSPDIPV